MKEKLLNLEQNVSKYIKENPNLLDEMERKNQQRIKDEMELLRSLSQRKPPKFQDNNSNTKCVPRGGRK